MKAYFIKMIVAIKHNPVIRRLSSPLAEAEKKRQLNKYQAASYSEEIKQFHNIHQGKRCFIIGNGPSLTIADLEKIENEYSFGANRIFSLFDKTSWRPTYYTSVDKEAYKEFPEKIAHVEAQAIFLEYTGRKWFRNYKRDNIFYLFHYEPFKKTKWELSNPEISEEISKYVSASNTVTFVNIQLAIYMGFKEIYLLGVDHHYAKQILKDGTIIEDKTVKTYAEGIVDTGMGVQFTDATTNAYEVAREYCEKHNIQIFNATRGGKLEVFSRVDFDTLWS